MSEREHKPKALRIIVAAGFLAVVIVAGVAFSTRKGVDRAVTEQVARQVGAAERVASIERSLVLWRSQRAACQSGRALRMKLNETTSQLGGFLRDAAVARRAAYERSGAPEDLAAAEAYEARVVQLSLVELRNCRKAYPPPPGLSEADLTPQATTGART